MAVGKGCSVVLNLCGSLLVDKSGVRHRDRLADVSRIVHDRNGNLKLIGIAVHIIIDRGIIDDRAIDLHYDTVLVEGQSLRHGIVDLIGIFRETGGIRHLTGDRIRYRLADIDRFLVIHLVKRYIVLIVDRHIRVCCGQIAEGAGRAGYEIIAERQTGYTCFSVRDGQRCAGFSCAICLQCFCELRCAECICCCDNINIRAVAGLRQGHAAAGIIGKCLNGAEPLRITGNGIRVGTLVTVVSYIKNLVSRISLCVPRVVNGDGTAVRGKRGNSQAHDHEQCQQKAGEFFHVLHCSRPFICLLNSFRIILNRYAFSCFIPYAHDQSDAESPFLRFFRRTSASTAALSISAVPPNP